MRIIGGRDYYDGTAFRSDGTVLSMLVYRRGEDRHETRDWMRSSLGLRRDALRLGLETFDDGPSPRRTAHHVLKSVDSIAHVRWNGYTLRLDEGGALFCGTMRRSVLVRTEHERSGRRAHVGCEWCWSADDLETTMAAHGLRIGSGWDRTWFDPVPVADHARAAGLCVATLDPTDPIGSGRSWRIEAPTLEEMGFEQVLPAKEALARLADWVGGSASGGAKTRLRVSPAYGTHGASIGSHGR